MTCAGEDFVFVGGIEGVHEVEVAFDEFEEGGLFVDYERDGHCIEIGQGMVGAVVFEVEGVAAQDEFDAFFPELQAEGASAAGMLTEVGAVVVGHFVWHHAAINHAQQAEKGAEGLFHVDDEGRVVGGGKAVHLAENPSAGGGDGGVEYAVETVEEVLGGDGAGGVGGAEQGVFVEVNVVSEGECVGFAVGTDVPGFGDGGLGLQLLVETNQPVVQLGASPDDGLVFGEGGVEGSDAGRLVVAEYLFVGIVGNTATRGDRDAQKA